MRLISWQRLGIIASVVWVVVGPSYFHLSREDNDRRITLAAGGAGLPPVNSRTSMPRFQ